MRDTPTYVYSQTTGIKKRGLLLDLNCLPSQVARLIVRGFSQAGYYYLLVSLPRPHWPLSSLFSSFTFFSSPPTCSPLSPVRFALLPRAIYHPRFHEPRLGTPRSRTFRSRNNSGSRVFSPSSCVAAHQRSCRALVIMRGEPCISHRGIIRECFRQCPPPPAVTAAMFFPRLFFSYRKPRSFNPSRFFLLFSISPGRPGSREHTRA